jgi:DNA repair exonuclease SbcCD nuclease subunit
MVRIAHFGDTHIKNLKYHYEYRKAFEEIYKTLRAENVDYIVHTGDLAHTKTQLSPEYFELATDFLKNLADIAETHIILGNHDGNLRNSSRQDAITPIVEALDHASLILHKYSGEVQLEDDLTINVLSIFDETNWQDPTDPRLLTSLFITEQLIIVKQTWAGSWIMATTTSKCLISLTTLC